MTETTTYDGGCHCGRVRYRIETALTQAIECNCSICGRTGELIEEILHAAGIPEDAYINLFASTDQITDIIADPRVRGVSLTGSEGAGAAVATTAAVSAAPLGLIEAARALGASPMRIIRRHVLPNAMAPAIVVTTINLGSYIAAEATLSFLGIGLRPPTVSWGVMINDALTPLQTYPHILFFPALFLSIAVLAFIMLGDAVRDAFDPKSR